MRSHGPFGSIRRLAISTGIAVVALLAATGSSQARFGGGFRATSAHTPIMSHGPRLQGSVQQIDPALGHSSGRFDKGSKITTTEPRHDGRHPPHRRPPHHKRSPQIGPIVGTGVAVGTLDAAGAGTPPSQLDHSSGPPARRGGISIPPGSEQRFVVDEVVLEFANTLSAPALGRLLARHDLVALERQSFALTNSTYLRARIVTRHSVRATLARLGSEAFLRTGQPNYYYAASQAPGVPPPAGDPAQYAIQKLHLNEAHTLADGDSILVAVIDSGIDLGHPELQGVIAGSYDALGKPEKPHRHGTGIAGAIAAHARLVGAAPAARILAIRAFGDYGGGAEATTFAILKGIDYAAVHRARVVNMSFAGPADAALARHLAAAHGKGMVLVAASGNLGPKAGPQYPAADPNVIAVSATDAGDLMFKGSSVGPHIAVAAPGVDILLPAPGGDYQVTSGTSFAAAYVSGVAALVLQRAPGLSPEAVRRILESTARDLGPRGKDKLYGSGLVDAYGAVTAVPSQAAGGSQDTAVLAR